MKNYRAELTGVFGDPVDDNPTGVVEEAANFTVRIAGTPNASTLCGISATRRWLPKKNTSSMILYA